MFKKDGRADCSSSLDSIVPALEAKLAVSSQMLLLGVRFPVGVLSCKPLCEQFEPRLIGKQLDHKNTPSFSSESIRKVTSEATVEALDTTDSLFERCSSHSEKTPEWRVRFSDELCKSELMAWF